MRIKHKMNIRIADDTSMKNLLFAPDDELAEVVADGSSVKVLKVWSGVDVGLSFR